MRESFIHTADRIDSVDIFRGLTVVAMILVNDLARVQGIPAWLRHAPEDLDAMTFPDVVFPAFLFIVGMAIPLAMQRRAARGENWLRSLLHILVRTAGLLAIGVLMVNTHALDAAATGLDRYQWAVLMYLGVILAWNAYPPPRVSGPTQSASAVGMPTRHSVRQIVFMGLRLIGFGLLIWLAATYRGPQGETWLRTQWWGILGLIGWAYLVSSVCFLMVRGHPAGVTGLAAMGLTLCIAEKNGALAQFSLARAINEYVSLGGHIGGHSAIVLSGVLAMTLVHGVQSPARDQAGLRRLLGLALLLGLAGLLLRYPYGLSKVRVTPGWCLYCAAICCAAYALLHWIVELKGYRRWAGPVRTVGSNALLAFILPGLVYGLLQVAGVDWLSGNLAAGGAGMARSVVFTLLMTALLAGLSRAHVRLRL